MDGVEIDIQTSTDFVAASFPCTSLKKPLIVQGRGRLFKSGLVEEAIEYRRHESGINPPLVRGVWGASPENFFFEF